LRPVWFFELDRACLPEDGCHRRAARWGTARLEQPDPGRGPAYGQGSAAV